ncbi:hypothetical protein CUMW_122410 [Citrus unshiu]|uniref:Uncharacterized protein n=1 Tax=Citrus unshiu TaxID=55188 RepID=A0A2H5PBY3_CITUN|nr:hypothetical protein CUMW_122410 [Citrus unshiu]
MCVANEPDKRSVGTNLWGVYVVWLLNVLGAFCSNALTEVPSVYSIMVDELHYTCVLNFLISGLYNSLLATTKELGFRSLETFIVRLNLT